MRIAAIQRNGGNTFSRWPAIFAALGALLLVVGVTTLRESYRASQVDEEMDRLQRQIDAMEGKRTQLSEVIRRLQSPDALDKEARTRFGLKKEGERVFVLEGEEWKTRIGDAPPLSDTATDRRSNPQKWLAYFFLK